MIIIIVFEIVLTVIVTIVISIWVKRRLDAAVEKAEEQE